MAKSRITDDTDLSLDDLNPDDGTPADPPEDGEDEGDLPDDEGDGDEDDEGDDADEGDDVDDDQALAANANRGTGDGDRTERVAGRATARIRTLNSELAGERAAREELQRRFDAFVSGRNQPTQQQQGESQEQRNARRALMSDAERAAEDVQELRRDVTNALRTTQVTTANAADKASFDARITQHPIYGKWSSKVEAEHARLLGLGQFVERRRILAYLIGDAGLSALESGKTKAQRATARRRVERQTTRANDTRNDATPSRRGGRSLEDRLANQPL